MAVTKRDFEVIAAVVRDGHEYFAKNLGHAQFASDMAEALLRLNPRFNRKVFLEACVPHHVLGTAKKEAEWDRIIAGDRY